MSHAAKDDWKWVRSVVDAHRLSRQIDPFTRLRSVDLSTLAVADATIGLPPSRPTNSWSAPVPQGPGGPDRDGRAGRPGPRHHARRAGSGLAQAAIGALRGNRWPRDVVRVLWGVLLPVATSATSTDRSAVTAGTRALWRRVRTAIDKLVVARFRRSG